MSCDVGHRLGSDPTLLWLWCRAAAAARIPPLAWKLAYAAGMALKKKKKKTNLLLLKVENSVSASPAIMRIQCNNVLKCLAGIRN